ncbi:hypothetical protein CLV92_12016 [Kineococcus xinjiangensis]|uniref:Antitoxin VbhA domain-containing protein n=1 Tax=Kineococcus xinjiangensis TaxID=512762 RepID=A0A2S6ICH7_9ACTN|nr:hypothetical protein CLV92_12016 [Kineococcus xinjiangensis]
MALREVQWITDTLEVAVTVPPRAISAAEQERRRRQVETVRASTELEGGRSDDEARAEQDRWVRGEIDVDELVRRARAQCGLT